MALSLRKNFGFALAGNLFYAGSQYVILLIFVKMYSLEDVGTFIYAGAFSAPLMLALEMQLRNLYITDDESFLNYKDYNSFRIITSCLGFFGLLLAAFFLKPEYFVIIFIVALIKVFESQLDLIYGIYQKKNHLNFVAYSRIIRGIIAIVMVLSATLIFQSIIFSLLAYLISWVGLYFFYERKEIVKRGFIEKDQLKFVKIDFKKYKYFVIICLPVFCSIFIDKYYLNYPRVSVEKFLGVDALAIFGSLLYFKTLGGQFITSLAQAAMPRLSEYIQKQQKTKFLKLVMWMILIGIAMGGILVFIAYFWGSFILRILYTEEYAKYGNVLVVVLLGTMITFGYSFITSSFTALRKQWIRLPISILMLTTIVLLFVFKPVESLLDVAYIVLYSEVLNFIVFYIVFMIFFKRFFNGTKNKSSYDTQ